jgi:hypothetical protein
VLPQACAAIAGHDSSNNDRCKATQGSLWVILTEATQGRNSIHVRNTPNSDGKFNAVMSLASCQEET